MSRKAIIDLNGFEVNGELEETPPTTKAILVNFYGGFQRWIPKSQSSVLEEGETVYISVNDWLAEEIKKELEELELE